MKKLTEFGRRYRKKFWFALLVNAGFLLFLLLVTRPAFETNDDIALATMFNGARGSADPYSDVAGYLYGLLMVFLYRITPVIPWHSLFTYAVIFLSLSAVTYIIQNRFRGFAALLLSSVLLICFGYECYAIINFTRTAACAAAAGTYLIVSALDEERIRIRRLLAGSLLFFTGFIIRTNEGLALGLVLSSGAVYLILKLFGRQYRGKRLRRLFSCILSALPVAVLVLGAMAAERSAVKQDPAKAYYRYYSDTRSRLMDHSFPGYAENHELYEELDINNNAWNLYRNWNFYDPDKFSPEIMEKVASVSPRQEISMDLVRSFLKQYPDRFFRNTMFLVYLFLLVMVILYGRHSWPVFLTVLYQLLTLMATELYLFSDRRYGLNRVEMGIWFGASLILLLFLDEEKFRPDGRTALTIMLAALILDQSSWRADYRRNTVKTVAQYQTYRKKTLQMSEDKEHLYLCSIGDYPAAKAYGPFQAMPDDVVSNIVPLGSWSAGSITYINAMKAYGVENPYRDMIGNEKVRLVASDIDMILTYLKDYYDPDCTAEKVGKVGKSNVYVIHA